MKISEYMWTKRFFSYDPADVVQYVFIENFCGVEQRPILSLIENNNINGFSLQSFLFDNDSTSIFIHCEVFLEI